MDFELSDEQQELQAIARKFAYEELIPASLEADRQVDPAGCYRPDLIARADDLGLRTLALPREYGGLDASCMTQTVVLEELCTGDVGFGMSLQHAWREGRALAVNTTPEQRERFLPDFIDDPTYLTSFANTEDHWGSDSSAHSDNPADGPRTTAVLENDEWVINGRKRWITNSNVARIAFVLTRTDSSVPWRSGSTMILVPTDTPGYVVGRIEDKLGIRMNQNAEIIFENCRVPRSNVVGEVHGGAAYRSSIAAGSKTKTATKALGVARAAFEEAVAYARERVQGGKPIIEHQSIAEALVNMEMSIEATRTLIYKAAWLVDQERPEASRFEAMAKAKAAEVAAEVAIAAIDMHGANGISRGRRIEKLVRDAVTTLHIGTAGHAAKAVLGRALAEGRHVTGLAL